MATNAQQVAIRRVLSLPVTTPRCYGDIDAISVAVEALPERLTDAEWRRLADAAADEDHAEAGRIVVPAIRAYALAIAEQRHYVADAERDETLDARDARRVGA